MANGLVKKGEKMKVREYVRKSLEKMIEDIEMLVSHASVYDVSSIDKERPFGTNVAEALNAFLNLAEKMGMETRNFNGYAGDVTIGHGKRMIGILGHIDVVNVTDGWKTPPFLVVKKNGNLYGRGTSDDKGPLVSCLYAMKYIMENKLLPESHSIRLIIGTDEEEEYRCINYYLKKVERLPDLSFIPDANFPLIYAEKGLIDFDINFLNKKQEYYQADVLELQGGNARNIVPSDARCKIAVLGSERECVRNALNKFSELKIRETADGFELLSEGVSCHAMNPEKGKNAIASLLCGMKESGISFSIQHFLDKYDEVFGRTFDGSLLGCAMHDEITGDLTVNVGTICMNGDRIEIKSNVRYPVSNSYDEIMERMIKPLEKVGFNYKEILAIDPLYIEKSDPIVSSLMEAYREVTGDFENSEMAIGGATYARFLPCAVSFGPLFPWEPELAHEDNECISIDSLEKITEIYIIALKKLIQL